MPKFSVKSILKKSLPWILIFHPKGLFKSWGPWIGLVVLVAALPFLINPTARERLTQALPQPSQTATAPTSAGPPAMSTRPGFDPLATSGAWSLTPADRDRGEWSWETAKRFAAKVWAEQSPQRGVLTSYYCGCPIAQTGPSSGEVDLAACGYQSPGNVERARRLEWEHIVPASALGAGRACWSQDTPQCRKPDGTPDPGRSCCERTDPIYQMMANDPVNLAPSVGEVNGLRSNHTFGRLASGAGVGFGQQCQMRVDSASRTVEPPENRRGDIARVHAYMSQAYGLTFTRAQAELFTEWMQADPVSPQERALNETIRREGHRPNPLVLQ